MDQSLYSSGALTGQHQNVDPQLDQSGLLYNSGTLPNQPFTPSSLIRSSSLPLLNEFAPLELPQAHRPDPVLVANTSYNPDSTFRASSNQSFESSYADYAASNQPLAESDQFLRSALNLSSQLPSEMYNFPNHQYPQTPCSMDASGAERQDLGISPANQYESSQYDQVLHVEGDTTPIQQVMTPTSPSVTEELVGAKKSQRSRKTTQQSSVDEDYSRDSAPDDEHSMSARVVFQALRTTGAQLAVTYEDLKRQNQLLALQLMNQGAISSSPPPSGSSSSYQSPLPQITPISSDPDFLPPPPKRQKLDPSSEPNPVPLEDAKSAIHELEKLEASKLNELNGLRAKMSAFRSTLLDHTNWLAPAKFEHRRAKKLEKQTYEAMYYSLIESVNGIKESYFVADHPKPDTLADLAGVIYIIKVQKVLKKPPQVGFSFRSYSDSHYTSVERSTPIICKVKEWPCEDDTTHCYRLYHYYLGSQRKNSRAKPGKNHATAAPVVPKTK